MEGKVGLPCGSSYQFCPRARRSSTKEVRASSRRTSSDADVLLSIVKIGIMCTTHRKKQKEESRKQRIYPQSMVARTCRHCRQYGTLISIASMKILGASACLGSEDDMVFLE